MRFDNLETTVEISRCTICGPVTKACQHGEEHVTSVLLTVYGEGYSDPGKTYGPPEDCYPPEGEVNPTGAAFGDWKGEFPDGLTDEELKLIDDALWAATDDWEPDEPERDYRDDFDDF